MAQELIDKIRAAAQAKGIDPEVALGIARAESGLDPNAKAKSSTAAGLFQILNNTWSGNKGAPGKQFDPDENIRVGTDIISKNVQSLKGFLGRDPSPKEVYAAHYFGATGAQNILSAAPDTPTKQLFSEKVLAANPNLKNKTAAQVLAQLEGKLKIPTSNVSRETKQAKTEPTPAEEMMTRALPAGTTASVSRETMSKGMPDIKSLPASYQAAFALAALADAKDDEKEYDENKETESEKLMREYKPVNHLASLDLSVTPVMMKDGGDVGDRLTPQQIEQYVGQKTKAQLLLEKFKEQAHPRNYTSIIGLGPNIVYETYKYATGKDPLRDLQKELQKKIDYEVDTGSEPIGTDSGPISGSLPPIRRAEGSPEEGEDVSKPFIGNPNISRQVGQARRNAAIQKASYRDEVAEAKDTARKGEAYQELEKYLQSRGEMPNIKVTSYLPEGTHGMFSSDKTNVGTGTIKVNKNVPEMFMPSTIAHEMTHAADRQMMMQAKEQGMFGNGNQFTEAYEKMVGPEGRNRTQLLRKRYPEFEEDNRYYRADPKELAAHAIGAYSGPAMQDRAPRHVDATAATELRILMDLAQRNVDKGPTGLAKIPAFFKRMGSYADGGEVDMEGQEIKFSTQQQPKYGSMPVPPPPPATRSAKELDAYIKAMNPGAKLSYFPAGSDTLGHVSSDAQDILNIQKGLSPQKDEETKLHELEHSLTFRAGDPLGRPKIKKVDNNYQAYYMLGDWRPMSQFTQNMVDNREKLEQFFGRPLTNAYFRPETLEVVRKQHGDTSALFDEQLASLSALEQITGKSLTRDPEMKKLFPNPRVMSVYDALTGPRQTRLDARDLPPSTPQPAYVYRDNPVTQFLHKNLLGDNFYPYKKPVRRADGGDAEPTAEELAAASTPAFIAQKSGIGRKAGPVSQALQSGQGQIEFLKGMTNVPQNILGAPMDISNMIANVYGGGVEKPFMGSEYIKEGLRSKGLGFTPSTDPTLAGFYGAGDLGSNLVNPAGVTRAGVKAAEKTGEAARMLAQDFQQYNQNLAVPGASYAIRNRGTPFLNTPAEINRNGKVTREAMGEADDYADWLSRTFAHNQPALKTWLRDKVGAYLRRDFGTESDQMVQAADQGKKLHFMSPKLTENVPHQLGTDIGISRELEGFPKSGFAKTPQGQKVEEVIDSTIYPLQLQDINTAGLSYKVPKSMTQFVGTNPEMRVSQMGPIDENLKFDELAQAMEKMFKEKEFKAYGETVPMPKDYILTEETLKGLTPAQASNRVANKMEWVEKKRGELAGVAISKDPQIVSHSYDNGSKWISPGDLANNPNHAEMVKDIGCSGGWCTDKATFAMDYGSGENRLNILLDKKFEPRVQLTVNSPPVSVREFILTNPHLPEIDAIAQNRTITSREVDRIIKAMPEYLDFVKQNQDVKRITEIKGQFNNADLRNSPYLKQVQDFVKRQGPDLLNVHNLEGINMVDARVELAKKNTEDYMKKFKNGYIDKLRELNGNSFYVDEGELPGLLKKVDSFIPPNAARALQMNLFQSKATGGMIERQPNDNRRYL